MRISDWSSDVCSSDLTGLGAAQLLRVDGHHHVIETESGHIGFAPLDEVETRIRERLGERYGRVSVERIVSRSEEHTSELQSLMRISYAVFCLKKKKNIRIKYTDISIRPTKYTR